LPVFLKPFAAKATLRSRSFSKIFTFSVKLSAANVLRVSCFTHFIIVREQ
jgi:hypothetical protein